MRRHCLLVFVEQNMTEPVYEVKKDEMVDEQHKGTVIYIDHPWKSGIDCV